MVQGEGSEQLGVASWGYLGLFLQGPSGGFHLGESAGIAPKGKLVLPNSLVSVPLKGVLSQASWGPPRI